MDPSSEQDSSTDTGSTTSGSVKDEPVAGPSQHWWIKMGIKKPKFDFNPKRVVSIHLDREDVTRYLDSHQQTAASSTTPGIPLRRSCRIRRPVSRLMYYHETPRKRKSAPAAATPCASLNTPRRSGRVRVPIVRLQYNHEAPRQRQGAVVGKKKSNGNPPKNSPPLKGKSVKSSKLIRRYEELISLNEWYMRKMKDDFDSIESKFKKNMKRMTEKQKGWQSELDVLMKNMGCEESESSDSDEV